MTDFERIKGYYSVFDEKNRLNRDNSGRMEYEMTMHILQNFMPESGKVLDIGGGAGVYSFLLADAGYQVYLADLSERLIEQARERKEEEKIENLVEAEVVNAIDLSRYEDNMFDVVIALGPFYHLTGEQERRQCVSEIHRVLKDGGIVIAGFIPHLSGSIAIIERFCYAPQQVDASTIADVFATGNFHNLQTFGFQEGHYATAEAMEKMFTQCDFETSCIRSVRGFAYEKEDMIYGIEDKAVFREVMEAIHKTATDKAIVDMCGHAVYIGRKNG